jgi:hypothetical protein
MRQWQDADATHLPVSTMCVSQKTVDHTWPLWPPRPRQPTISG